MDILHLVDRLEELFNASHAIPLTHNVIVDEDKFLDIIDQMRITVPEEVKKAQEVYSKKTRHGPGAGRSQPYPATGA